MLLWVVALDVIAPIVFSQTETESIVKLGLRFWQLNMCYQMVLGLLVKQPIVTMTINMFQLCLKNISSYVHRLQSWPL